MRFILFVLRVQCHCDVPDHGLARVDSRRGSAVRGGAEKVFEPPTALQSLINCCDQCRPPWAGLKGFGLLLADELGKSFPRVGEGRVAVDLGG